MLNRNAGLKSRFTNYFDFEDWLPEDSTKYFINQARSDNFAVESGVEDILHNGFGVLKYLAGWANGRDVKRAYKDSLSHRAKRLGGIPEELKTLTCQDVQGALDTMIKPRNTTAANTVELPEFRFPLAPPRPQFAPPPQALPQFAPPLQAPKIVELEEKYNTPAPREEEEYELDEGRDPGVSDEIWAELEIAKKEHEEKLARMKKEMEDAAKRAAIQLELAKQQAIQEKLRRIKNCPAGFAWYQCSGGWRCGGGSHFVSDAQLNSQFSE
jgi:hypothetical protein